MTAPQIRPETNQRITDALGRMRAGTPLIIDRVGPYITLLERESGVARSTIYRVFEQSPELRGILEQLPARSVVGVGDLDQKDIVAERDDLRQTNEELRRHIQRLERGLDVLIASLYASELSRRPRSSVTALPNRDVD
jgi:hypothetical protein